jgi:hypothetical protein
VGGKADWLANGLPREGPAATVPYAGELVDRAPPTCGLATPIADVRAALDDSDYEFCLVVNEARVVLGRVRRSAIRVVDRVEAECFEPPRGSWAQVSESVVAVDGDGSGPVQLRDGLGIERLERDVDRARKVLVGVLVGRQDVDELDALVEQSLEVGEVAAMRHGRSPMEAAGSM